MIDAAPRRQDRDRRQEGRQDYQEHADAVDAEVIVNRRIRDPVVILDQRIAGLADRHFRNQEEREDEFNDRNRERQPTNPDVIVAAQEQERERAQSREEDQDREQSGERHQRTIPMAVGRRYG